MWPLFFVINDTVAPRRRFLHGKSQFFKGIVQSGEEVAEEANEMEKEMKSKDGAERSVARVKHRNNKFETKVRSIKYKCR